MMRQFAVALMTLCLVGCNRTPIVGPTSCSEMTLFSIDGNNELDSSKAASAKPDEVFHGFPVLGKVKITDEVMRKKMIYALKDAYARRPKDPALCFFPRHGLRIVENGRTMDLAICFECQNFAQYGGDESYFPYSRGDVQAAGNLNRDIQPIFDKPLTDAGIPIAP